MGEVVFKWTNCRFRNIQEDSYISLFIHTKVVIQNKLELLLVSGPRGFPLIGIIHELKDPEKIYLDLHKYTQRYGEIYSCYMGRS